MRKCHRADDASLIVIHGRSGPNKHAATWFVDNLLESFKRWICFDPTEFVLFGFADRSDGVSIRSMYARLKCAKFGDEIFRSHSGAVLPQAPGDGACLTAKQAVGALQQILPSEIVLAAPTDL